MPFNDLVEKKSGPVSEAASRLLAVERRFGFDRDVECGLFRVRCFAAKSRPAGMTPELADWVQERLGIPPLLPQQKDHRSLKFVPATFASVRSLLLDEERFGIRSPDDTAWFDPSPESAPGIAERDACLRDLLALLEPASVCALINERLGIFDRFPMGAFVLAGDRSQDLVLCARVGDAAQLDTRANAATFNATPT